MTPLIYKLLFFMVAYGNHMTADKNFRVLDVMTSGNAEMNVTGVHLIQTPEQWFQLWTAIEGDSLVVTGGRNRAGTTQRPVPRVDFEKNIIVGLFGGAAPNVEGYQVIGAEAKGPKAILQIRPIVRPGGLQTTIGNPYLLVLLPRTKKEIEVQMLVPGNTRTLQFKTLSTLPKTFLEEGKDATRRLTDTDKKE